MDLSGSFSPSLGFISPLDPVDNHFNYEFSAYFLFDGDCRDYTFNWWYYPAYCRILITEYDFYNIIYCYNDTCSQHSLQITVKESVH